MIDLAVLVGPTAAGKTTLGADLAARLGGEIVSADAFAVYRGLDIGTAKPSAELRAAVAHHLIDVADPRETYSAGMFMRDASAAIADIHARGHLPIVVGGTLFYVSSLLRGLFPEPPKVPALRAYLEAVWAERPERVRRWLELVDAEAAGRIAPADRQRSLRALEVSLVSGRPMTSLWREDRRPSGRFRALVMGVTLPREVLHARIAERVEAIFAAGLLEEVDELLAAGVPPGAHALKAIGYRECCDVLRGRMSLEEAVERTKVATRQLAKRQITWLRGESDTVWLAGTGDAALELAVSQVEAHCGSITGSAQG